MSWKGSLLFFAVLAVAVLVFWQGGFWQELSGGISLKPGESREARVIRAIDGDTLLVQSANGTERVRMIGIDTPESIRPGVSVECGAKEASAFMKRLADGKGIRLEDDPGGDTKDIYGRTLAYVYPQGSSRTFQEEILEAGWAEVYVFSSQRFSKYGEFVQSEETAEKSKRGVWRLCGGDFHSAS